MNIHFKCFEYWWLLIIIRCIFCFCVYCIQESAFSDTVVLLLCCYIWVFFVCVIRHTAYKTSSGQLCPPRCLFRETTAREPYASSRPNFHPSWSRGCVHFSPSFSGLFRDKHINTCPVVSARQAAIWGNHPDFKQPVCRSRETRGKLVSGRLPGLSNCLHGLPLHGDALWEGTTTNFNPHIVVSTFCNAWLYIQVLKKIARYIRDQNEKIYAPRGLLLTDPIERGLRVVSSVYSMSKGFLQTFSPLSKHLFFKFF